MRSFFVLRSQPGNEEGIVRQSQLVSHQAGAANPRTLAYIRIG